MFVDEKYYVNDLLEHLQTKTRHRVVDVKWCVSTIDIVLVKRGDKRVNGRTDGTDYSGKFYYDSDGCFRRNGTEISDLSARTLWSERNPDYRVVGCRMSESREYFVMKAWRDMPTKMQTKE